MKCDNPIFICGHIKTGTSLMAALLDSHKDLQVFPEELFLFSKLRILKKNSHKNYEEFWDVFFNDIQIKKMFGEESTGLFGNVDYSDFDAKIFKKKCVEKTEKLKTEDNFIINIYESIFKSFNEIQNDKNKRWVEKTPMNEFNFHFWLKAYPKAQFIYMKRNPMEVFSSVKKKRTIENINYSVYNFIVNYKTSLSLANHLQRKYPNNFKIIELEHLKNNTEQTIREVCRFTNIGFSEVLLKPSKLGRPWKGNSMFSDNKSTNVESGSFENERLKIINSSENQLIDKYLIKQKTPLIDFGFMRYNLKAYLKVKLTHLWLEQFLKKVEKTVDED